MKLPDSKAIQNSAISLILSAIFTMVIEELIGRKFVTLLSIVIVAIVIFAGLKVLEKYLINTSLLYKVIVLGAIATFGLGVIWVLIISDISCTRLTSEDIVIWISTNDRENRSDVSLTREFQLLETTKTLMVHIEPVDENILLECIWISPFGIKDEERDGCRKNFPITTPTSISVVNVDIFQEQCRSPLHAYVIFRR